MYLQDSLDFIKRKISKFLGFCGAIFLLASPLNSQAANFEVFDLTDDPFVDSLRAALLDTGPGDTITFDPALAGGTIDLLAPLPLVRGQSIFGPADGSITINGQNLYPGFFVYSDNVELTNLNIVNTLSEGGTGGTGSGGGGGALGTAAGLFVNSGTTVTISNITFDTNLSVGGNGGTVSAFSATSGGGGGGGGYGSHGGSSDTINSLGGGGGGGLHASSGGNSLGGGAGGGGGLNESSGGNSGAVGNQCGGGGGGGSYSSNGGNGFQTNLASGAGGGAGGGCLESPGSSAVSATGPNGPNGGGKGGNGASALRNGGNGGAQCGGGGGAGSFFGTSTGGNASIGGGGGGSFVDGNSTGLSSGGTSQQIGGGGGAGGSSGSIVVGEGGDGGLLSGGGGGGTLNGNAGNGGFGGGGGGLGSDTDASPGIGGFGAGNGGEIGLPGGIGSALGGSIMNLGILNISDSNFSNNNVSTATFGTGTSYVDGKDFYLKNGSTTHFTLSNANAYIPIYVAGGINEPIGGTLVKEGPGSLWLYTQDLGSYNGDIIVNEGTVGIPTLVNSAATVNSNGTLKGTGFIRSILNSGKVAPGNSIGTLTTNTYVQTSSGTLEVELNAAGQSDLLVVNGTASLDGTVEVLPLPGGVYLRGTTYTILTAGGGVNGTFNALLEPSAFQFQVLYFPNFVQLRLLNGAFGFNPGGNPGRTLDYLAPLATEGDIADVLLSLTGLTENQFYNALNEMNPVWFGSLDWASASTLNSIRSRLSKRTLIQPCNQCGCDLEAQGGWVEVLGNHMEQSKLGRLPGFQANDGGILLGYDRIYHQNVLLGVSAGYTHTYFKWNMLGGHVNIDSVHFAPYMEWNCGHWVWDASVIGSVHHYRAKRHLEFSTIDRKAKSDHIGGSALVHLGGAYCLNCPSFSLTPYMGVDYLYFDHENFKEHGAQSLNLHVLSYGAQMIRTEIGAIVQKTIELCGGCLVPTAKLGFVTLTPISGSRIDSSLNRFNQTFFIKTTNKALCQIAPGLDLTYSLNQNVSLNASYEGYFGEDLRDQNVSFGLDWRF